VAPGPNLIAQEERPSIFRELAGRAKNPLNGLLLSLAFVSYFLGDIRAAVVIGVMVVLAIGTAFIQEHRSNEAAAKLRAMVRNTASVKRRSGTGNGCAYRKTEGGPAPLRAGKQIPSPFTIGACHASYDFEIICDLEVSLWNHKPFGVSRIRVCEHCHRQLILRPAMMFLLRTWRGNRHNAQQQKMETAA
jgi:hypothetical protein